ncbi:MAG: hypothetical protein GX803_08005 [Lentisphaerae bacterium]|jgi:hypothetical protein|nr:hypothetical protein [Lentisphaerota bacterium]
MSFSLSAIPRWCCSGRRRKHALILTLPVILGLFIISPLRAEGEQASRPQVPDSVIQLMEAIERLPSDDPVPLGTQGYGRYQTQKEHWLVWLNPDAGDAPHLRKGTTTREAHHVYNQIVEPKMLLWLISACGVDPALVRAATEAAETRTGLASKSAAIRQHVPWSVVEAALEAYPQ